MNKIKMIIFTLILVFVVVGCSPKNPTIDFEFPDVNIEMEEGETYQLLPSVTGIDDYTIIYSDFDEEILSVSSTGLIEALSVGVTTIKSTLNDLTIDINVSVQALSRTVTFEVDGLSSEVEVVNGEVVLKPTVDPTKTGFVFIGWFLESQTTVYNFSTPVTADITLVAKFAEYEIRMSNDFDSIEVEDAVELYFGFSGSLSLEEAVFISSDEEVISIVNNVAIGVALGSATITATSIADENIVATKVVEVVAKTAKNLTLALDTTELAVEDQTRIIPTVTGTDKKVVVYSISDTTIAYVSSTGIITARKAGAATITASLLIDPTVTTTVNITVGVSSGPIPGSKTGVLDLKLHTGGSPSIVLGGKIELTITGATSRYNYNWTSSDPTVATVGDIGNISAIKIGFATITATLKTDSSQTGTYVVKVYEELKDELFVSYSGRAVVNIGETTQLLAISTIASPKIGWTSSDNRIAMVSNQGEVRALSTGIVTISAYVETSPDIAATASISVVSGDNVETHSNVFNWLEQYIVGKTLSTYIYTYGTTTKMEVLLGSAVYFWPGTITVDTTTFYRFHETAPGRKYITIHCTGNNSATADARANASFLATPPNASIHYVIDDSDPVYRVCPEESTAWHAGSTTSGLLSGNSYAIGIEMCQNEGNDLFLTWHRTAKFLPEIMSRWSELSSLDVIKQHHSFSGKNCPQELRETGLWTAVFANMVKAEYQYYSLYSDYTISYASSNTSIMDNTGHIISRPLNDTIVTLTVTISKDLVVESKNYDILVPSTIETAISGMEDWTPIS